MATPAHDKYYLRSLHQEIDLFDRKLAHLLKYDSFATDAERTASAGKIKAKRELLVRTARQLAKDGIEFKSSELPRSFRTDEEIALELASVTSAPDAAEEQRPTLVQKRRLFPSPYAGTMLDAQADVEAYKRNRTKAARTQS